MLQHSWDDYIQWYDYRLVVHLIGHESLVIHSDDYEKLLTYGITDGLIIKEGYDYTLRVCDGHHEATFDFLTNDGFNSQKYPPSKRSPHLVVIPTPQEVLFRQYFPHIYYTVTSLPPFNVPTALYSATSLSSVTTDVNNSTSDTSRKKISKPSIWILLRDELEEWTRRVTHLNGSYYGHFECDGVHYNDCPIAAYIHYLKGTVSTTTLIGSGCVELLVRFGWNGNITYRECQSVRSWKTAKKLYSRINGDSVIRMWNIWKANIARSSNKLTTVTRRKTSTTSSATESHKTPDEYVWSLVYFVMVQCLYDFQLCIPAVTFGEHLVIQWCNNVSVKVIRSVLNEQDLVAFIDCIRDATKKGLIHGEALEALVPTQFNGLDEWLAATKHLKRSSDLFFKRLWSSLLYDDRLSLQNRLKEINPLLRHECEKQLVMMIDTERCVPVSSIK